MSQRWVFISTLCLYLAGFSSATLAQVPGTQTAEHADDWLWWRGPGQRGIAQGETPPLSWSSSENIQWRMPIAGKGHGSPIVVGPHIYLPTADGATQTQSVLCFRRSDGEKLWEKVVHEGDLPKKLNKKATHASSTIACDGDSLYISFVHDGGLTTTSLTQDGDIRWQRRISDYVVHQGYGSSATIYRDLVLVTADNKSGGRIVGLNRQTGKVVWSYSRPKKPNYPSPIVVQAYGREQLVMIGCDSVVSLDPASGEELWKTTEGSTTECVTSTVTDGRLVFSSGGYPKNHVAAIRADGSGEVVWENNVRVYVPSMLVHDGYLYAVADAGIAYCWHADSGELAWRGRLDGDFTATPRHD